LFVTKLTLTYVKTDSYHLQLHSLNHFHFTLLRVMSVDSEVKSTGMVQYHAAFFTILLDPTLDQDLPLNPNTNFKCANP